MSDEPQLLRGEQNFIQWCATLHSLFHEHGLESLETPLQTQSYNSKLELSASVAKKVTDTTTMSNSSPFCTATSSIRSSRSGDGIRKKRAYRKTKVREVRWTKASRYCGQATFDLKNNMDRVKEAKTAELLRVIENPDPFVHHVDENLNHSPIDSGMKATDFYSNFNTFVREENMHLADGEGRAYSEPSQLCGKIVKSSRSNKLTNDVKDIYHNLMGAKDDALQWLELWRHGKSIDWWFPLFKAMYALLKLHQTIFEYANQPTASPVLQRLLEKYAMAPSLWQTCVHDFMDVVKSSNLGEATLADIECYLQDTKSVISSLQQGAGHLNQYWESYQAGLDHYLDCLVQIREGRVDWSHPEVFLGDSQPGLLGGFDLRAAADDEEQMAAGFLGYHGTTSATAPSNSISTTATDKCPRIAAAALTGWTVFGQGIADTFDYYSRMFKILSWTSLPDAVRKFTEFLTNKTSFWPTLLE